MWSMLYQLVNVMKYLGRTIELDGNPLTDSARFRDGGYIGSDKISSGCRFFKYSNHKMEPYRCELLLVVLALDPTSKI